MKFLARLFGTSNPDTGTDKSASQAKARLRHTLTYDRNGLEYSKMEVMRTEITEVISKHIQVSSDDVKVQIDQTADTDQLVASVPLRPLRRSRGNNNYRQGNKKRRKSR